MIDDIKKAIEKKSFGIYVGAGLSMGAGLPSWEELLNELISILERKDICHNNKIAEMRELSRNTSKFLLLAEEIRELIPSDLEHLIRDRFDNKEKQPTDTHDILVKLKSKFIITTNYDTLIEKALIRNTQNYLPNTYTYQQASSINYSLWNNDFFVLKAHGNAKVPREIILTEKDYRSIIYSQRGYQSILHAIFSTNSLLFVGASLNDPELLLLLGYIHNIFHGGSPNHYALMPSDGVSKTEIERWRKDYNIHIVAYNSRDNHRELKDILDKLLEETGEAERT